MANYTWKMTANGEFLDPGNWDQGAVPGQGDTAVVDTSALSPTSSAKVATFLTDATLSVASVTYRYTWSSQGYSDIPSAFLTDSTIGAGTTLAITSTDPDPNPGILNLLPGFDLSLFGAVGNAGTLAVGSPGDGSGTKVTSNLYNSLSPDPNGNYNAGSFSNSGLISVGYGSYYNLTSSISMVQVANTGTIAVSDGATFVVGNNVIGVTPFTPGQGFANDGLVSVVGAAGTVTQADFNLPVLGHGTMIADGGGNTNAGSTGIVFSNNVAEVNVELQNHAEAQYNTIIDGTHTGGSVTFEDNTSLLFSNPATASGQVNAPPIYGFQAGDFLGVTIGQGVGNTATTLSWSQASNTLSVLSGTSVIYAFTLMGTYAQGDFSLVTNAIGSLVGTTNTSNQAVVRSTGTAGQTVLSVPTGAPVTTAANGATVVNLGVAYSSVTSQGRDTINAGAGQASVVASGAATTVAGGAGRLVFQGGAGSAVVSTGSGGGTITTGTASSQVFLGSAADVVSTHGQDFVVASTGTDTVYAASAAVAYGGSAGQLVVESGSVASTVVGGGGDVTVYGSTGGGGVVYAGTGATEFVGGPGASTFVGSTGTALVYGGAGGGAIYAGSGGGQYFGAGAPTVIEVGGASTVTASDGNAVFVVGSGSNLLVAGAGNVTLAGGTSSGANSYFAGFGADQVSGGSGNDAFVAGTGQATLSGGGGANLFSFVAGSAGGADVITDFHPGVDHLSLQGYAAGAAGAALSGATQAGGATVLLLADGTRVTLLGVGALHAGDFV